MKSSEENFTRKSRIKSNRNQYGRPNNIQGIMDAVIFPKKIHFLFPDTYTNCAYQKKDMLVFRKVLRPY